MVFLLITVIEGILPAVMTLVSDLAQAIRLARLAWPTTTSTV